MKFSQTLREMADLVEKIESTIQGMTANAPLFMHKEKGGLYKLLGEATLTSGMGDMNIMVYISVDDSRIWARKKKEFLEKFLPVKSEEVNGVGQHH